MDEHEAYNFIAARLKQKKGRLFNVAQIAVIKGAWKGQSYSEIEASNGYSDGSLSRNTGGPLFKLITEIFESDIRITKKTFKGFIETQAGTFQHPEPQLEPPKPPKTKLFNEELTYAISTGEKQLIFTYGPEYSQKSIFIQSLKNSLTNYFVRAEEFFLASYATASSFLSEVLERIGNEEVEKDIPFEALQDRVRQLLQQERYLLILKQTDSVYQQRALGSEYKNGCQNYGAFLNLMAQEKGQSCIIWVSRNPPVNEEALRAYRYVHIEKLGCFTGNKIQLLFAEKNRIKGSDENWDTFARWFNGHPYLAARAIDYICSNGQRNLEDYLQKPLELTSEQIQYLQEIENKWLSDEEKEILRWLAMLQEPVKEEELRSYLRDRTQFSKNVYNVLTSLKKRSLCHDIGDGYYQLPLSISVYILEKLIQQVVDELKRNTLKLLHNISFLKPIDSTLDLEEQGNIFFGGILEKLRFIWLSESECLQNIREILHKLRTEPEVNKSYAAGNLINVAIALKLELNTLDFSNLYLRQIDFRKADLRKTNFEGCYFHNCIFNKPISAKPKISFTKSSSYLAIGDETGRILLWNMKTHKFQRVYNNRNSHFEDKVAVETIGFQSSDQLIVSSIDSSIRRWNIEGQETFPVPLISQQGAVREYIKFNQDGQWSIAIDEAGKIYVADIEGGQEKVIPKKYKKNSLIAEFCHNSELLATSDGGKSICFWDIAYGQKGRQIWEWSTEGGNITCINFHSSKNEIKAIVVENAGNIIKIHSLSPTKKKNNNEEIKSHQLSDHSFAEAVILSPNNKYLAWVERREYENRELSQPSIYLSKVENADNFTSTLLEKSRTLDNLTFSPDSEFLAATGPHSVLVWKIKDLNEKVVHKGYWNWFQCFATATQSEFIATGHDDGTVRFWDKETGQHIKKNQETSNFIQTLALSHSGNLLAGGTDTGQLLLVRTDEGKLIRSRKGHPKQAGVGICYLEFSADENFLALVNDNGSIAIWEIIDKQCRLYRTIDSEEVKCLRIATDNRKHRLIYSNVYGEIFCWDFTTNKKKKLREVEENIKDIEVSNDSREVIIHLENARGNTIEVFTLDNCNWSPRQVLPLSQDQDILAIGFDQNNIAVAAVKSNNTPSRLVMYKMDGPYQEIEIPNTLTSGKFALDGTYLIGKQQSSNLLKIDIEERTVSSIHAYRPYEGMALTACQGLKEPEIAMLTELGAIE